MYRISLSRIDDRNQRMQRFHTEIIVVLLHSVYSLYLIHLQLYLASIAKITFSFIRFSPSDEIGYYICGIDTVYTPNNRYFFPKNRHKAQRKAKFYINKCRSASCMQGGLKQASA